jgi:hypothetical protein
MATGAVGTFLGDLFAQYASHFAARQAAGTARGRQSASGGGGGAAGAEAGSAEFEYDAARCARLVAFSAALGTPIAHYWWGPRQSLGMGPAAIGIAPGAGRSTHRHAASRDFHNCAVPSH